MASPIGNIRHNPQIPATLPEEKKSAEMERFERAFAHDPPDPVLLKRQMELVDEETFLLLAETFSLPFDSLCQLYWLCNSKKATFFDFNESNKIPIREFCRQFLAYQISVFRQMPKRAAQELFLFERLGKVDSDKIEMTLKQCNETGIDSIELLFGCLLSFENNFYMGSVSDYFEPYLEYEMVRKIVQIRLVYKTEGRGQLISKLPDNIKDFEALCKLLRYFPCLRVEEALELQANNVKQQFPDLFFQRKGFKAFYEGLTDKEGAKRVYEEMGGFLFAVLDFLESFQNSDEALDYLIKIEQSEEAYGLHLCRGEYCLDPRQVKQIIEEGVVTKVVDYQVPFDEKVVDFATYVACLKKANSIQEFRMLLSFKLNPPRMVATEEEAARFSHIFPLRKNDWGEGQYGGNAAQSRYGKEMYKGAKAAAKALREKKIEFSDLLYFHAFHRFQVASSQGHNCAERYGYSLNEGEMDRDIDFEGVRIFTKISSFRYQNLGDKILHDSSGNWIERPRGKSKNTKFVTQFFDETESWGYLQKIIPAHKGKEVTHTEVLIVPKKPKKMNEQLQRHLTFPESGGPAVVLFHSNSNNLPKMMPMAEKCYKEAIEIAEEGPLYEKLGELFWWICTAKPWKLGDPSIAELVVRSILLSKDFEIYPWNVDLIPWEEVVITDTPEEFGKRFSSLFDREELSQDN